MPNEPEKGGQFRRALVYPKSLLPRKPGLRHVLLALLFCLLAAHPAAAQPLALVEGVEDGELRAAIQAAIGERTEQDDAIDNPLRNARRAANRAERLLRSRGYYGSTLETFVDPAAGPGGGAGVRIVPGPLFAVGSLDVDAGGDEAARQTAAGEIELAPGDPLQARAVIAAEARGIVALHSSGWPDAEIRERQVVVDHAITAGAITYRYTPGTYSLYGEIDRDTGEWNPDFIARLTPLQPGAPASREEMREYQRRLESLDSVNSATVSLGAAGPDSRRPVSVEMTARPRHTVQTGLSYSTSEGGGAEASWRRRNMFGRDETLRLHTVIATLNKSLLASLTRPHWRRYRQTVYLESSVTREETDAYDLDEIAAGIVVTRRSGERRTYAAGVNLDHARVIDRLGDRNVTTGSVTASAAYDARDNPLNAADGYLGSIAVTPTATFGDIQDTFVRLELRSAVYQRLTPSVVAAARVRLGSLVDASAEAVPADDRFFAGGGGSARGFDYQSLSPRAPDGTPLGGLSVVETSTELRWRVRERWGLVGFVDAAMASRATTPQFGDMRAALGFGVRYHFDFAPVRFDIATPLSRRDGETPVHIYFSLGQAF